MRSFTVLFAGLFIATATAASAETSNDKAKSDMAWQANLAYAAILEGGVKAGRLYSRDATVSGNKRFVSEFVARQFLPEQGLVSAE